MKQIVYIGMCIIMLQLVSAIGISPGQREIDFTPNEIYTGQITIHNLEKQDFDAIISYEGDLEEFVEITDRVSLAKDEDKKTIDYVIRFPDKAKPGPNELNFMVVAVPKESLGQVTSTTGVISKLIVDAPYPDKYLTGELYASENLMLRIKVKNQGSKRIEKAYATAEVNGKQGSSDLISLEPGEEGKLTILFDEISYGFYDANVQIHYDEKNLELEEKVQVGGPEIVIKDFDYQIDPSGISRFTITIENLWIQKVDGVAEIQLGNENLSFAGSRDFSLGATSSEDIEIFIEEPVPKDDYNVKIKLKYNQKETSKNYNIVFDNDKIVLRSDAPVYMMMFIILLMVLIILLYFKFKD